MKILIAGGVVLGVAGAVAAVVLARRRKHPEVGGSMSVGAVDEVELGGLERSVHSEVESISFDPERVPSEHSEINDLREKMP
jgi:hypothetical protein